MTGSCIWQWRGVADNGGNESKGRERERERERERQTTERESIDPN